MEKWEANIYLKGDKYIYTIIVLFIYISVYIYIYIYITLPLQYICDFSGTTHEMYTMGWICWICKWICKIKQWSNHNCFFSACKSENNNM